MKSLWIWFRRLLNRPYMICVGDEELEEYYRCPVTGEKYVVRR